MADGTDDKSNDQKKVEFTPEQQELFNRRIQEAMGRAAKEVKTENDTLKTKLTELEEQLKVATESSKKKTAKEGEIDVEAIQRQLDEAKQANKNVQSQLEDARKMAELHRKDADQAKAERLALQKRTMIQSAASDFNFIDVHAVERLTEHLIQTDSETGKLIVVREDGTQRMNSTLDPMTLKEFFAEFAASHQYLVRSDAAAGTGAAQNNRSGMGKTFDVKKIFGKESVPRLANELKLTNPQEYARLKQEAKEQGLI